MSNFLLESVLQFLYPRKCVLCHKVLQTEEADLCHSCRVSTPVYPFGAANPLPKRNSHLHFLDSSTAIWYYEGNVRKSLHRYKFRRATYLAPAYGRLLGMQLLRQNMECFDMMTWVPVSARRKKKRGYDQAQLLAEAVGEELHRPPVQLLVKQRDNPPQSGIAHPEERKANVIGVYTIYGQLDLREKNILLIDDIFTTGATCEECARVLLTAGAKSVQCATVAAVRSRKK